VPRPRSAMRKIKDVLRLELGEGLSRRQLSAPELVDAHPTTGAPLMAVALCGRAVRPFCVMDRQRFDERAHLVVGADADEVDLIGHPAH
jgi:hypothetical protein